MGAGFGNGVAVWVRKGLRAGLVAAAAAALAGCASLGSFSTSALDRDAPLAPSSPMILGERAAPPAGYLDFCARQPAECGLPEAQALSELDLADRKADLYRRYFWAAAFQAQPADTAALATDRPILAAPEAPAAAEAAVPAAAVAGSPAPETSGPLALTSETLAEINMVNRLINSLIRQAPDALVYGTPEYWNEPLQQNGLKQTLGDCEDYVLEKRHALIARGVPAQALSIAVVRTWRGEGHAVLLVATDQGELVLDSLSNAIVPWNRAPYVWVERQAPGQTMSWFTTLNPGRG